MSRLAELIEQLCPDGVEYRPLCELVRIRNGCDYKALSSGNVPVYGSGGVMTHVSEALGEGPTVLIPRKGSLDNIFFVEGEFWTVDTIFYTEIASELDPKFFFYKMKTMRLSQMNEAAGVPSMNQKKLGRIQIPLPPLEVQREIVRVLDQFTTLEAELEAELEARQAQYEHYRNYLLSYDSLAAWGPVDMVELGSVVTLLDSRRIPLKKGDRVSGEYPYYGASGIVDYVDSYIFDEDLLLVSEDGANLKARTKPIAFSASGRVWVNNHAHVLRVESSFYQKFLEEYLNSLDLEPYLVGSTQPKLNQSGLLSIPVPLPTEQALERSVLLLEKLKLFVTDFSAGLPAEIAARRAQYEHYRDRLLSFPEKKAE
jgi:restriction modification system DNA specificity domain protein